jgi:hypothetical protein
MRCRRNIVQLELSDPRDMVEHRRELARHRLDLILAER